MISEENLKTQREKTLKHLQKLQEEADTKRQELEANQLAQHQVLGRLRYIEENLGLVEPFIFSDTPQ